MANTSSFPEYMCKGSKGPHVSILHAFLAGGGYIENNIVFDGEYGGVTNLAVRKYQEDGCSYDGPRVDGNFGGTTAIDARDFENFDFEAICKTVPGTTVFAQPDGTFNYWTSPAGKTNEVLRQAAELDRRLRSTATFDEVADRLIDRGVDSSSGGEEG